MNPFKVLLCTFSQTGSTEKVAQKIAEGLNSSGIEVNYHSIPGNPLPDFLQYDAIGIGTPVYAFRPPFPVTDFIKVMPDLKKKYFFVFVQYGSNPGSCGNLVRKQMAAKHAIDAGYLLTRGEDYFIGYLRKGYLMSDGYPGNYELQTAVEFGVNVAQRMTKGYPATEPYDPRTHFMYAIERASVSRFNTRLYLARSFRTTKECDGCGICVKKCPVNNLKLKDKRPVWGNNCMMCVNCELKCPKDAIRSYYDWAMNMPFYTYNIRKALKENIPHARIKFEKGRIVRTP